MANGNGNGNIAQSILLNLNGINSQLKNVVVSLNKLEANEITAFKENYDVKNTIINEVKQSIQSLSNLLMAVNSKIESKTLESDKDLQDIKTKLVNLDIKISKSGNNSNCESCAVIKEKETTQKRLWWAVAFLMLALLAVLGLNLFGYIHLPGIGK